MTTTNTMNDLADSLDAAAANLEENLLDENHDLKEFASKTVYSTFYYFSYGVCFVSFLAGKVIPQSGVVAQGLRDGATAAKDAVDRIATPSLTIDDEFDAPVELAKPTKRTKKEASRKPSVSRSAKASSNGSSTVSPTAKRSSRKKTSTVEPTAESTSSVAADA